MDRDLLCGGGIAPQLASAPNQRLLKLALVLIAIALATATAASAQTYNYPESSPVSGGGTLNWTLSEQMGYCGSEYQDVTDTFENFSYTPATGSATGLSGSIYYLYGCDAGWGNVQGGWDGPGGGDNELDLTYTYCTVDFDAYIGGGGNASLDCPALDTSTFVPAYKVTSILYSPPGNQSSQSYTSATTNGTTSSVANSFSSEASYSFSGGAFLDGLFGAGGGASFSYKNSFGNTDSYTQQWVDASGVTTVANTSSLYNPPPISGGPPADAMDPYLDTFEVWLNPYVSVESYGTTNPVPVSYNVYSNPITLDGETAHLADVLPIVAWTMLSVPGIEESTLNPEGSSAASSIPVGYLVPQPVPQENGPNVYLPGMGAICANNAAYTETLQDNNNGISNPGICTQGNQCGCAPSDFAGIEALDPLLGYNSTTYRASPGNGTVSPLAYDNSGASVCGENQPAGYTIPSGSDCRYVIVPSSGTNIPIPMPLGPGQKFSQTESDTYNSTLSTNTSNSYSVGLFSQVGFFGATLKKSDTFSWTDSESSGTSTGNSNSLNVTLYTTNPDCSESVSLYEDTLFHTYAFQVPEDCN
jgi:hypothetical protein